MHNAILYLNLLVSLASVTASMIALRSPSSLSGSSLPVNGDLFYLRMYVARAIPLGLAAGILPFWPSGPAVAWVVFAAALVQLADVAIGFGKKEKGMIVGASIGTLVHLICGFSLL